MRHNILAALCLAIISSGAEGQAVQATRSLGRINEAAVADSNAVVVGQLTARMARFHTVSLGMASIPHATGVERLERLALEALEKRKDPQEFARAVTAYQTALSDFETSFVRSAGADTASVGFRALRSEFAAMHTSTMPAAISKYVPNVLFSIGGVLIDKASADERRSGAVSVSTNLVGQVGGTIVSAVGAGNLADYLKDNVVMGVSLNPGKSGKPSGALTAGLGEVKAWGWTFWPVLGFEQTDTAGARIPSTIVATHPTVGTWSSPVLATSFTWMPLADLIKQLQNQSIVPIVTVGVRFPFYFPGNTTDALGALFSNKISDYVRGGRPQLVVAVDIPLLKVNPAELVRK